MSNPCISESVAAVQGLLTALVGESGAAPRLARLTSLVRLTLEVNRHMNLTADREEGLFWPRHVEDALQAAVVFRAAPVPLADGDPVLDVGSGGGIPGLVWAILWPGRPVVLLESRGKKAGFIRRAADELGLENVTVLDDRAEVVAHQPAHRERYVLVTARALAPLPTLAELTLPFTRPGGYVAAIKSAALEAELAAASRALRLLGSDPARVRLLPYTRTDAKPCSVCLLPKLTPAPIRYPRHEGVPKASPL